MARRVGRRYTHNKNAHLPPILSFVIVSAVTAALVDGMATQKDFCPVDAGLTLMAGKWKPRILWKLHHYGVLRYSAIRRLLPGITDRMLAQQLRELEDDGLVARTVYPVVPPRVEYAFTPLGATLAPVLDALTTWSRAHEPRLRAGLAARSARAPREAHGGGVPQLPEHGMSGGESRAVGV